MSQTKQASKQKRRRKAVPILGAAGLSLSLASGASAAIGPVADMTAPNAGARHEITLAEEEISDVRLVRFHVFDKESVATPRPGGRLAMGACGGGCGGGGCGGCGCWTGTYYTSPVFGDGAAPAPRTHAHAPKHKHVRNNP